MLIRLVNKMTLLMVVLFHISAVAIHCQNEKLFSSDKEISSNLCNDIYQDRKGFVWIATEDGLNKFDGMRFTIYRNIYGRKNDIKCNYVVTLYEDRMRRFWIGCSYGLQLYNRATDNFEDVDVYKEGKKVSPYITSILECSNNDVWIATSGFGIAIVRPHMALKRVTTDAHLSRLLGDDFVTKLVEDSQHRIWIATRSSGIFCYYMASRRIQRINCGKILINNATAICEDWAGNIFVATRTKGLYRMGRHDRCFSLVPYRLGYNDTKVLSLFSMPETKSFFVGTDGQGMKEFDYHTNMLIDCQPKMTLFDFSKAKIHCMLKDRDNNLWLGLFQKGVLLQSGHTTRFDYFGYKSVNHNCIGSCCVLSIFVDAGKTIWVGTDNDGIYAIDKSGRQLKHFRNIPNDSHSVPATIEFIYGDSKGELWVGSFLGGVGRVDKNSGAFTPEYSLYSPNAKESDKTFSCMIEDRQKNLWIGTFGSGLFRKSLTTGATTLFKIHAHQPNSLPQDWINCLMMDRKGNIWIGTYLGLACYDTQRQSFIMPNRKNVLLDQIGIFSLYEDKKGYIWVGTVNGLFRLHPSTQQMTHYTIANGLPNNTICGIEEDENQNLWISSHHGLSKFVRDKNIFYNYNTSDGIQGSEFWYMASHKDEDGRIYFGGNNGITAFYPKDIVNRPKRMEVLLTAFYISNHPITMSDKSDGNRIIDTDINDAQNITISHNENTFSLEFSTLEYINPDRIYYRYRILELNKEWSTTLAGNNIVTYTELPPGKYTFQVQAVNLNEVSGIKTITIHITPPWYSTWWASCIWVVLLLVLCWYLYFSAKTYLKQRQELLEKQNAEKISEAKLQFFMNLSHELRTPITLITSPLEKLLLEHGEHYDIYKLIYRNAQRMLNLVNQLLDIRKIDKGYMHMNFEETDIVSFIENVMTVFEYQAQKDEIRLSFIHSMPELKVWIDVNNFDKVLINILSNAFKYTFAKGEITISLEEIREGEEEMVQISVSDTGVGIDEGKTKLIFERFYQIDNFQTNAHLGTGIGLHLSKLLVEMHHGKIWAERRTDTEHGSRFIICIPRYNHNDNDSTEERPREENVMSATDRELRKARAEWAEDGDAPENNEKATPQKNKSKLLVVEDEDDVRQYLIQELSPDFIVLTCTNGKEALTYILKERPDLVISDIMMPVMDGIELCKAIKKNSNICHIPIVLLTARSTIENKIEGLETGADAYMEKPFNMILLREMIINLIHNRNLIKKRNDAEEKIESDINAIDLKSNDEVIMERVLSAIDENMSDPDFNVDALARCVGFSRAHLYRKIKEITDLPVKIFIRDIRLKQAAKLLKKQSYTISEIAYAVGFSNVNYFTTVFKEFYGMTPKEYKNSSNTSEKP
jgi:signal transduction histidine kinase/ligand-binding sensor domain-containing protein/DNA-binding response OmpR family regulator